VCCSVAINLTDIGEPFILVSYMCMKKLMVFDNPIVRWLATRRRRSMYALACKLNTDCDLLVASRTELKSRGSVLRGLLSVMSSRF